MSALEYSVDANDHIVVDLEGEIEPDDTLRLSQIIERALADRKDNEGPPWLTISFNSPGGDYIEGLKLGLFMKRNGYQTLVRNRSECHSAAAFAFLGGAFLGAVGGWGPDRRIEVGASVGFHAFYSESQAMIPTRLGVEDGKTLSRFMLEYANELRLDLSFVIESLAKRPDELLLIETVEQCRTLRIAPIGRPRTRYLTIDGAINAANYATSWRRPVSLAPRSSHSQAVVNQLTRRKYCRTISKIVLSGSAAKGLVEKLLKCAAFDNDDEASMAAYEQLEYIALFPREINRESDTIFHVTGFDYGGGFYTTDVFVIPHNEGTDDLSLTVLSIDTGGARSEHHYTHSGDFLFEVHDPAKKITDV